MKNVLVLYYSQSGQLETIAKKIAQPLENSNAIQLYYHKIEMKEPFPFPWNKSAFFDVFPESFLQIPAATQPISPELLAVPFDLILLHYQVWYLSPSVPVNSFLNTPEAALLFKNTPVVTITGSRNMWVMAQEKMKVVLQKKQAVLKGNIALVDRVGNLISVITIVEWLFSGVKKRYLGIFPLPGVSEKDINESSKFGTIICNHLLNDDLDQLQAALLAQNAVKISSYLVTVDKTANKIFEKWSNFILSKKKSRKNWLKVFNVYLWLAIWLISPIVYILHILLYPLKVSKIKKEKEYYQSV